VNAEEILRFGPPKRKPFTAACGILSQKLSLDGNRKRTKKKQQIEKRRKYENKYLEVLRKGVPSESRNGGPGGPTLNSCPRLSAGRRGKKENGQVREKKGSNGTS